MNALRTEHKKITEAIDIANRDGKLSAQKKAQEIVAAAEKKAQDIMVTAEVEAINRVAVAERRLAELGSERNTIAEYVKSIRVIVGAAVAAPEPAKKTAAAKRSKPRAVAAPEPVKKTAAAKRSKPRAVAAPEPAKTAAPAKRSKPRAVAQRQDSAAS